MGWCIALAEVSVLAVDSSTVTGGELILDVRRHLSADMPAPRTEVAMVTVSDYAVCMGQYLDIPPLVSVVPSFFGVTPSELDTSWPQLAQPEWSLFDPLDAGPVWPACGVSEQAQLYADSDAVDEVIPDMPGDFDSAREFTVISTVAGADWSTPVPSGRCWVVLGLRVIGTDTGPVLSFGGEGIDLALVSKGGVWQVVAGATVVATIPRHASQNQVTVVGVDLSGLSVTGMIREGAYHYPLDWTFSGTDMPAVTSVTLGGPNSTPMLVYVFAMGSDDSMPEAMALLTGVLT